MDVRDALEAGISELTTPIERAINRVYMAIAGLISRVLSAMIPVGACRTPVQSNLNVWR